MPLVPQQLDDRKFEDLLAEAKLRLQRYCPEWTDFNDSDPGIALVQLFAWLTELMLYRINQIPERNYIQFLKLLNLERHPARPSRTQVVMTTSVFPKPGIQSVRERSKFQVTAESGQPLTFETVQPIDLIPYPVDAVQVFDGLNYRDFSELNSSGSGAQPLRPLGWTPQIDNALYLGFHPDQADTELPGRFPDQMVLYFFFPASRLTPVRSGQAPASGQALPTLVWEYQSRNDRDPSRVSFDADRWRPLTTISDMTASLKREGQIILRGPADCMATTSPLPVDDERRFWIRGRLVNGSYPTEQTPEIAFVRANVVEVENRATFLNEVVGIGDGTTTKFQLRNHPVDADSLTLVLVSSDNAAPQPCLRQDDLYLSKLDDLHFTLNPNSGEIQFGNGKQGVIPGAGLRIVALSYRAGGGTSGNIPAGAIKDPPLGTRALDVVTNPRPALGGMDEETLAALLERAPRILRGDARAVTKDDYRRFAEEIPGVGRAIVLPQYLRQHPGLQIPGAVTVIVIPASPRPQVPGDSGPPRFEPAQELLDSVARRLDECRPAGTEVEAAPPRLRTLNLHVEVTRTERVTDNQAREQIKNILEDYFRPVGDAPPESPVSRWVPGTPIYPSRLFEVLLTARDSVSDAILVRDVVVVQLQDHGAPIRVGESLILDPDELPHVLATVQLTPPGGRRRQ